MNEFVMAFYSNPIVLTLLFICILIIIFKKNLFTYVVGRAGEHWTKEAMKKLPQETYIILNDIMISVNNKTYQIDHIIISKYGLFVIETKQYHGYITGNKYDKKWVRVLGKKRYYYTNPIRQNFGHIKAISELLKIDESKIYNVVCIPSNVELHVEHDGEVVRYYELVDKVLSYNNEVIDNVDDIYNTIRNSNITDNKSRKEHVKNIKENMIEFDSSTCPKCGGQLVKRKGKYGNFIGCSNYPKCKYTRQI